MKSVDASADSVSEQVSEASVGEQYRYKRFSTGLLFKDFRFGKEAAAPGDSLPSFELITTTGDRLRNCDVFRDRPVLFIFGSMTCPMTASAAPSVQQLHSEFGDRIEFIMLYVREAHPGEHFTQAETIEEKLQHARALKEFYDIEWTVAADNIDGELHLALDPKPNAAYLMNKNGDIEFRSLWAADYGALRDALSAIASGTPLKRTQSSTMIGPVARAMGSVQEVMDRAGPQAVRDLWRAGLPMALAGRIAPLFYPLAPDQRGVAAVFTLVLGALGLLVAWILS